MEIAMLVRKTNRLLSILHLIKRIVLALISIPAILFCLCVPIWLYGVYLQVDYEVRVPPPGRMVDIGTHKLHINCRGSGSPTVVLDAGGGMWSAYWNAVKGRLSDDVRVCAYDRAGMGWSEKGPSPRNAEVIANELSRLLAQSGEAPPYLMVGHSFGGTIALAFIEKNIAQTAGFVAVETPTYNFMKWRHETRFVLQGRLRRFAAPVFAVIATAFSVFSPVDPTDPLYNSYSEYEKRAIQDVGFRTRMFSTMFSEEPFAEGSETPKNLGSLPIAVIQGAASHLASEQWDQNQRELLSLSTNSKFILADLADHGVPSQAPEAVVDGIHWIIAKR